MGGILCGVIGLKYPEILFFGYETLNNILQNETIPTALLVQLLGLKIFSTAFCQASGLQGGIFAPSLFMGATLGATYHNVI